MTYPTIVLLYAITWYGAVGTKQQALEFNGLTSIVQSTHTEKATRAETDTSLEADSHHPGISIKQDLSTSGLYSRQKRSTDWLSLRHHNAEGYLSFLAF